MAAGDVAARSLELEREARTGTALVGRLQTQSDEPARRVLLQRVRARPFGGALADAHQEDHARHHHGTQDDQHARRAAGHERRRARASRRCVRIGSWAAIVPAV